MWGTYNDAFSPDDFRETIGELLPDHNGGAFEMWIAYAKDLDEPGEPEGRTQGGILDWYCQVLAEVEQDFGEDIATELFNMPLSTNFTLNPFEIYGAAGYLKNGVSYAEIEQLAYEGKCDHLPAEPGAAEEMRLE